VDRLLRRVLERTTAPVRARDVARAVRRGDLRHHVVHDLTPVTYRRRRTRGRFHVHGVSARHKRTRGVRGGRTRGAATRSKGGKKGRPRFVRRRFGRRGVVAARRLTSYSRNSPCPHVGQRDSLDLGKYLFVAVSQRWAGAGFARVRSLQ